ncbi:MAG: thioredoxin [Oscillospiraceae bacterium]|nr:thioredoxin [Oscillospiraceae bacterium]
MDILHLTSDNFDDTISKGKVLVDFWADWCGPCKILAPIFEELAAELSGNVSIAKVDIDQETTLAARYSVMSIPTVILFTDGLESKRFVGVQPKETYLAAL